MSLTKLISPQKMTPQYWLFWAKNGGFAILDQGLFAGANFLVNILLTRWLPPEQYGAFAVAYSVFLLLATVHTSVLTEPMLVFGASKYQEKFRQYLGFLLYGHLGLTTPISLILAVVALVFWRSGSVALAQAFFGLATAAPFILLSWLLRRAFYVRFQPQWAATGGGLYLGLMLAGLYGLFHAHWLSSFSALVVMGLTSGAVGLWFMGLLRPEWQLMKSNLKPCIIAQDHWGYASSAATASILGWVSTNLQHFVLAFTTGLGGVGIMRALDNLLMPYWHSTAALLFVLLPIFSRRSYDSHRSFTDLAIYTIIVFFLLAAVFYTILNLFNTQIVSFIYTDIYSEYIHLFSWYTLILFPATVSEVILTFCRSLQKTNLVLLYYLALSIGLLVGYLITAKYGISGAIYVRVIASYILLIFISSIFVRLSARLTVGQPA